MMMIPRRNNNFDLFDEMFGDPFFSRDEYKLMKTDIKEKHDKYLIEMDLPGYEKENINIEIQDGYLIINAKADNEKEEKDDEDESFIRRERYVGECSRSFYVGKDVKEEDVKATFKNGTLKIEVPKKEEKPELPKKKHIQIGE